MRGNELLKKMELVDPAYIEAAGTEPKKKNRPWIRWGAAAAACICLLAGTAAAIGGGETWLVRLFTRESSLHGVESGYELGAEIQKFPVSALSEEMQMVSGEIVRQSWRKEFSSAEEAKDFIGLDFLKMPDWEIGEPWDSTTLLVLGSLSGKIEKITIVSGYDVDDIVLQTNTDIYTEYSDEDGGMKIVMPEGTEFVEMSYTTANGGQCQVISSSVQESGRLMMSGHLVDNGIFYTLFVNYAEQDAARAEELLYQWADMF